MENAANYSVIYGSIGAIIVLLLWLYLSATMMIMGAEFNSVLMEMKTALRMRRADTGDITRRAVRGRTENKA